MNQYLTSEVGVLARLGTPCQAYAKDGVLVRLDTLCQSDADGVVLVRLDTPCQADAVLGVLVRLGDCQTDATTGIPIWLRAHMSTGGGDRASS